MTTKPERTTGNTWSEWLQEQLDQRGWRQADLVHFSGGAIKRDRVSKWINGIDQPSYRAVMTVADALGIDRWTAFEAAGLVHSEAPNVAQASEPVSKTDDYERGYQQAIADMAAWAKAKSEEMNG